MYTHHVFGQRGVSLATQELRKNNFRKPFVAIIAPRDDLPGKQRSYFSAVPAAAAFLEIKILSEWAGGFATTQWTLVWTAAKENPSTSRPAFASLFQRYWQPLYFVARQKGLCKEDAEDAIQEFFTCLLEDSFLGKADPVAGRFRAYLGVAWKRFLIDRYRRENTQKRSGNQPGLSLDVDALEQVWQTRSATSNADVAALFERSWAENVLDQVRRRLAAEYENRGRKPTFERLIAYLTTPLDLSGYAVLAEKCDMTEGAVKVALHRLRRRFGETLREIVAETVSDPREIDAEMDDLIAALK